MNNQRENLSGKSSIPTLAEISITKQGLTPLDYRTIDDIRTMYINSPDPIPVADAIGALRYAYRFYSFNYPSKYIFRPGNLGELLDNVLYLAELSNGIGLSDEEQLTQFIKTTATALGRKDEAEKMIQVVAFIKTTTPNQFDEPIDTKNALGLIGSIFGTINPNTRLENLVTPGVPSPEPATLHQWLIGEMMSNPEETFDSGYPPPKTSVEEIKKLDKAKDLLNPLSHIQPNFNFSLNISENIFNDPQMITLLGKTIRIFPTLENSYMVKSNSGFDDKNTVLSIYDELVKLGLLETFHFDKKNKQYFYKLGSRLHLQMSQFNELSSHVMPQEFHLARHILDLTGLTTFPDHYALQPLADQIDRELSLEKMDEAQQLLLMTIKNPDHILNQVSYPKNDQAEERLTQILYQYDHHLGDVSNTLGMQNTLNFELHALSHRHPLTTRWFLQYSHAIFTCFNLLAKQKRRSDEPVYSQAEYHDALMNTQWSELPNIAQQIAQIMPNISKNNPYIAEYEIAAISSGLQLVVLAEAVKSRFGIDLAKPWRNITKNPLRKTLEDFKLLGEVVLKPEMKPRVQISLLNGLSHRNIIELLDTYHLPAHRGHDLTHLTIGGVEHLSPAHATLYLMETINQRLDALEQKIRFARDTELFELMSKKPIKQYYPDRIDLADFCLRWNPSTQDMFESYNLLVADYRRRHIFQLS